MAKVSVIIAASPHDVQADGFEAAIKANDEFDIVGDRIIPFDAIATALSAIPHSQPCAVVLVGSHTDLRTEERRWLEDRPRLVVLRVDVLGDVVRIGLRDPNMRVVLDYLRELVERAGRDPLERVSHVQLRSPTTDDLDSSHIQPPVVISRPVLTAAIDWIQATLRRAGLHLPGESGVIASAAAPPAQGGARVEVVTIEAAEAALDEAIAHADSKTEPLVVIARRLSLTPIELRLLLLALAPEIDPLYQRCFVTLLGEAGRRVGSLGLYCALIGDPVDVRQQLTVAGNLARWRLIENNPGQALPAADESLHLDRYIVEWLLGHEDALEADTRLRNVLRPQPWAGSRLFDPMPEVERTARYLQLLQQPISRKRTGAHWLLFNGDQASTWHALIERAADLLNHAPLRVRANRIGALDAAETVETARRLTRLARLSRRPILLDASSLDVSSDLDDTLRLLCTEIAAARCRCGIICTNVSRLIGLLGTAAVEVVPESCLPSLARRRCLQSAVRELNVHLTDDVLQTIEQQFPLQADGWERALHLTRARVVSDENPAQLTQRFIAACREVAAETVSNLAARVDPHCCLRDVVIPNERRQQLKQIVDGVRFARHVLDDWQFGDQLAYGRGVTALFHGPSGTGKTMSALAIARELDSQVLRIDLSRVVSKYIGDTEKHMDAVFRDATQCGAVLLVDEADALLGKRSEVRDSHDRYANIEVSFLLQRIEAYDGVAIFTTNARQNLDHAFLRRLRFIIEFPRPDLEAREEIWRRCLPPRSHLLDEAAFRQLARKIDITGGHIRQITLQAAFLAAAANEKISLKHIAQASRDELAKLGLPPIPLDVAQRSEAA